MEKWALKIGLITKEAESDKALHWLTSAKGEDPALIGLTRVEGGGQPSERHSGWALGRDAQNQWQMKKARTLAEEG